MFFSLYLQAFYLPWAMLALDVIFGSPLMPDLLGIIAGHLYYFLTVLHPLATGKNLLQTPKWVYPSLLFGIITYMCLSFSLVFCSFFSRKLFCFSRFHYNFTFQIWYMSFQSFLLIRNQLLKSYKHLWH